MKPNFKYINIVALICCALIYSSFFSWGARFLEADGMQLFIVMFFLCPLLIVSGLISYIKDKKQLFINTLIPIAAGITIALPIIDRTVSLLSGIVGLLTSTLFLLLIFIMHIIEKQKNV